MLAERSEAEIAEHPDLVTSDDAQRVATIGLGRSDGLSAAGELFSHKGLAAEDASIGEIADTATQKLRERDHTLLLMENFLCKLHINACTGFVIDRSRLEKQLAIFPAHAFPAALFT